MLPKTTRFPQGVQFLPLKSYADPRGELTVLFNQQWKLPFQMAQLNVVKAKKNSFRGLHVHTDNHDYLYVLNGTLILGLKDVRHKSSTFLHASLHELTTANPQICLITPGVAHGFYFPEDTLYCYGLSTPWDPDEKLGMHWNSPNLGIDFPMTSPLLSERDAKAGSLCDLLEYISQEKIDFKL